MADDFDMDPGPADDPNESFLFTSSSTSMDSLRQGLRALASVRARVNMDNLRFESLCHGLASTLQVR